MNTPPNSPGKTRRTEFIKRKNDAGNKVEILKFHSQSSGDSGHDMNTPPNSPGKKVRDNIIRNKKKLLSTVEQCSFESKNSEYNSGDAGPGSSPGVVSRDGPRDHSSAKLSSSMHQGKPKTAPKTSGRTVLKPTEVNLYHTFKDATIDLGSRQRSFLYRKNSQSHNETYVKFR